MTIYDTIIVGMGAAGCSAASILCKAGRRVLALEAQNRVGGRVCTVPFGNGVVELGAEWIHGEKDSRVYELAIQHNIPLHPQDGASRTTRTEIQHESNSSSVQHNVSIVPQDGSFQVFRSDGTAFDKDIVHQLVQFAMRVVEDPPKEPEPLGQYLSRRLVDHIKLKYPELLNDEDFINQFLHFMELIVRNYEASNSWNDVTTANNYKNLDGNLHLSWHKYGYKTLFEIMLNTYQGGPGYPNLDLQLEKVVSKISYPLEPTQDVEVSCEDGSTYRARNVIVTVSLGVLKERHSTMFSPPLPSKKALSIDNISIGVVDKIALLFPEAWWPRSCTFFAFIWREEERSKVLEKDLWVTSIFGVSVPEGSEKALAMWTSGNDAKLVEKLPEDVVRRKSMEIIRQFMGKYMTIPEPIDMLRSSWYSNPYTRGSYTYDNLLSPQQAGARATLAQSLVDYSGAPRVLFAGEATDNTHFSTVHGAADTGHRAAVTLLRNSKL